MLRILLFFIIKIFYLHNLQKPIPKKTIVFLGSSIVKGQYGVDWISQLDDYNGNLQYVNAGINGAQVPTIIRFLSEYTIIKPYAFIIMVGSNDASSYITGQPKPRLYNGLSKSNPYIFKKEYEVLIQSIVIKYGNIPIGICSIKPISEKIDGKLNQIIVQYNQVLMDIVQKYKQTTLININARLMNELRMKTNHSREIDDIQYILSKWRHRIAYFLKPLISTNTIGNIFGYYLFCDGIHFNERGANIVKNSIQYYIQSLYDKKYFYHM